MNELPRIPRDLAAEARDRQSRSEWDEAREWAEFLRSEDAQRIVSQGLGFGLAVVVVGIFAVAITAAWGT